MEREARHPFILTWTDSRGVHRRELTRPFTIGRTPENDIMLDAPSVSRRHCVVTPHGAYIEVDASMSTNLVQSGGRRVATVRLSPGGSFTAGGTTFAVEAVGAVAPGQAAPAKRAMKPAQLGAIAGVASLGVLVVLVVAAVALTSGGGRTGSGMVSQDVIAAEGGVVAMPGGPSVTFPPGALDRDTTVTIRRSQSAPAPDNSSLGPAYDIEAGDAVLVEPAMLRMPFDRSRVAGELNSDTVVLSHFDGATHRWINVASALDSSGNSVVYATDHFSEWQVQNMKSGATVNFALPYDKSNVSVKYVGGPHQWTKTPYCQADSGLTSGVDFGAGGQEFSVLTAAPGRVVAKNFETENTTGPGFWVAIEHDGGLQSSYWHLKQDRTGLPELDIGQTVPQGFPVGFASNSGDRRMSVHAHVELGKGIPEGSTSPYGTPVSWNGRQMDGWTFWLHEDFAKSGVVYSYQGSATKGAPRDMEISISGKDGCGLSPTKVRAKVGPNYKGTQASGSSDDCKLNESATGDTAFACQDGAGLHLPSSNCERHTDKGGCVDGSGRQRSPTPETSPSPKPGQTTPPSSSTVPPAQPPAAPSQASIKAIDKNTVEVSWKAASNNHTGFRVYGTGGTRLIEASANFTSVRINGFSPGEQVCVNVRAFNSAGESGNTYADCATTPKDPAAQPPAAPSQASIKAIDKNTVEVSWKPGSTNQTGFRVYGTGGKFLMEASASFTSLRINGFSPGEQVCVNVRAFNSAGESGNTYAGCATTPKDPAAQVPAAPSQASIKAIDKNTVEVSWKAASTNHTGFRVYATSGPLLMEASASFTSARINGFNPGTQVCVNVRAFNSAGESGNTYAGCATTPKDPVAQVPADPSNVRIVNPGTTCLALSCPAFSVAWNDNSNNETGFRVYANGSLYQTVTANVTNVVIDQGTNLELPGTVCFSVSAFNGSGESARAGNACRTLQVDYSLTLDLNDLPDGHTFTIGQGISLCYWLTPSNVPYGVRLFKSTNGSQFELIDQWSDTGGGDCIDSTVGSPAGTRTYLAQAVVNGSVVAEDTTFIKVVAAGDGGDPPSGSCDRAPSTPTNFRLLPGTTTLVWDVTDPGGSGCNLTFEVNSFGGQNLYRGSTASFTLPTITCNSGYFIGAANQIAGFNLYALWACPN